MPNYISVIIPCYNEEDNIEECIKRIPELNQGYEIIVVDDGSTDRTAEVAKKIDRKNLKVIRYTPNMGKGRAIRVGIDNASGDIMAQVDADSQFPPEELPRLIEPILNGEADIVFGSRFLPESTTQEGSLTILKRIANFVVSGLISLVCMQRITDIQAGFKAWKSNVIRELNIREKSFAYEPEIAIMAAKKGYKITEVPVNYKMRHSGSSNVNLLRDGVIIPLAILRIKLFRK